MWQSVLAISLGASAGAVLRWILGVSLNPLNLSIPIGTLVANLLGGYLIGISVSFFADHAQLAPEWRLLIITGFLGGLTTFSTFSAEVVEMLQRHSLGDAFLTITFHVLGSLALTFAGIWTYHVFKA